jgi:hypothetical protein
VSVKPPDPPVARPALDGGIAVADLGERPSADPSLVVHELRAFDARGAEWKGLVAFREARDGRDTPEEMARALVEVLGEGTGRRAVSALASMQQPIRLFEHGGAAGRGAARSVTREQAAVALPEPADGREPGQGVDGPLQEVMDTYHLPRRVPVSVRLIAYFCVIGIPLPLLWALVLPHTVAVTVALGVVEVVIVFGLLFAIFLSSELTRLPRRRPVQAPSTKGL